MTLPICRQWHRCRNILLQLAVLCLSGCAPITAPPGSSSSSPVIGRLEATGGNVYYNFSPTTGDDLVRSGDNVSTGPESRAVIRLNQGGIITIDANTDPQFLQEAWCILVKMIRGQVHEDGTDLCFETPQASGMVHSEANFRVTEEETIITVFSGSVEITSPARVVVGRFQQVRVQGGRVLPVRTLSVDEIHSVFRWVREQPEQGSREDTDFCRRYADTAVGQQQENMRRQCGFQGGQWSSEYNDHYQWCLQVEQPFAEGEAAARTQALRNMCHPDGAGGGPQLNNHDRCQLYAEVAVVQQSDNMRRQCGFQGARWSTAYNDHYQWCLQVPQSLADLETRARAQRLNTCVRPSPPVIR